MLRGMARHRISVAHVFPAGTPVEIYRRDAWPLQPDIPQGEPQKAPVVRKAVSKRGLLSLDHLAPGGRYVVVLDRDVDPRTWPGLRDVHLNFNVPAPEPVE